MRDAMRGVVHGGTGTAAQIDGVDIGGKTGTAQLGTTPATSEAWFICFAGKPDQPASVAVAVIVEGEPGASESTGGRIAAPIARLTETPANASSCGPATGMTCQKRIRNSCSPFARAVMIWGRE